MPKGRAELVAARREEIINACEKLYQTKGFKEITLKDIGTITSFTRTSIYNYFQTKEEIFLALLQREYEAWIQDLRKMMSETLTMTKNEFAQALSHSLENRAQLLKIIAMNHYDMESGSRLEHVIEFKKVYGESLRTVTQCLQQYFPEMAIEEKQNFIYIFFPFMFGIYPYTVVNEKQKAAMEEANVNYVFMSIYEITYNCVKHLLEI
ncbi:TetR family transcriptional regulator [Terrisporobacter sp.]